MLSRTEPERSMCYTVLYYLAASVSFSFTLSTAPSASARCSPGRAPPLGWCGISTRGKLETPKNFASVRPSSIKIDWHRVTVGLPRCCSSIASWTLHDVHDPQAPRPVITASHRLTNSSIIGFGAPCMCVGFVFNNTSAGRYFS